MKEVSLGSLEVSGGVSYANEPSLPSQGRGAMAPIVKIPRGFRPDAGWWDKRRMGGAGNGLPKAFVLPSGRSSGNVLRHQDSIRSHTDPETPKTTDAHNSLDDTSEAQLPRDLVVANEHGRQILCPVERFAQHDGPVIVLGEPGSGKSVLARTLAEMLPSSAVIDAPRLEPGTNKTGFPGRVIVDGVSEIPLRNRMRQVDELLRCFPHHTTPNIALTCRLGEWGESDTRAIEARWKRTALVGVLPPLCPRAIKAAVGLLLPGTDGDDFLRAARENGIHHAPQNPHLLSILLEASRAGIWPKSKTELLAFECRRILRLDAARLGHDGGEDILADLEEVSGLVFAFMLLSDSNRISAGEAERCCLSGDHGGNDLNARNLARMALSSGLFHRIGGKFEPRHRSLAEYLAGRCVAKALDDGRISRSDAERLLGAGEGVVVPSLRALHGWIATLSEKAGDACISRDPHGVLHYGDRSRLPHGRLLFLLEMLGETRHQESRAGYSGGHTQYGDWATANTVIDKITQLARDDRIFPPAVLALAGSVKVEKAAEKLGNALMALAIKPSSSRRRVLVDALMCLDFKADFSEMVGRLLEIQDQDSVHAAMQIAWERTEILTGEQVADVLVLSRLYSDSSTLARAILAKMSSFQLRRGLSELKRIAMGRHRKIPGGEASEWIVPFLEMTLDDRMSPRELWSCLRLATREFGLDRNWDSASSAFLKKHPKLRESVQEIAVSSFSARDVPFTMSLLADTCPSLELTGGDFRRLLSRLEASAGHGWSARWEHLVRFGIEGDYAVGVIAAARSQARRSGVLQERLGAIEQSHQYQDSLERISRIRKEHRYLRAEAEAKRQEFWRARREIERGDPHPIWHEVYSAYFRRSPSGGLSHATPDESLIDAAGEDMMAIIETGVGNYLTRKENHVPAEEISRLHANFETSTYGRLLLMRCLQNIGRGSNLTDLPIGVASSALAELILNPHESDLPGYEDARGQLEEAVLGCRTGRRGFIKKFAAPCFSSCKHLPMSIRDLLMSEENADVAGPLSDGWLDECDGALDSSMALLFFLFRERAETEETKRMLQDRMLRKRWANETQRSFIHTLAFWLDFPAHRSDLDKFAMENSTNLWPLAYFPHLTGIAGFQEDITPGQCHFLLSRFGPEFGRRTSLSDSGGKKNLVRGYSKGFLSAVATLLGGDITVAGEGLFRDLMNSGDNGVAACLAGVAPGRQAKTRKSLRQRAEALPDLPAMFVRPGVTKAWPLPLRLRRRGKTIWRPAA